jgi:hypothetical protein
MELDFYLLQVDDYTIKVLDNTLVTQVSPLAEIYQMSLDIVGATVINGGVYNIDVLPHIFLYKRDREIYEITSSVIGLSTGNIIPDGTYTMTWTINNAISKTHKFCVYNTIKKEIEQLQSDLNYGVNVTTTDVDLIGDYCDGNIEQVRLAIAMMDSLRTSAAKGDLSACNDLLNKLNNLLKIIRTNYGKSIINR